MLISTFRTFVVRILEEVKLVERIQADRIGVLKWFCNFYVAAEEMSSGLQNLRTRSTWIIQELNTDRVFWPKHQNKSNLMTEPEPNTNCCLTLPSPIDGMEGAALNALHRIRCRETGLLWGRASEITEICLDVHTARRHIACCELHKWPRR